MVPIPAVFGRWTKREMLWHFEVDSSKGGRLFALRDGCTHHELDEIVRVDFQLDKEVHTVEISYALPDDMLRHMPPGTPPMFVCNDGQVSNLIELSRANVVRLCVSTRIISETFQDGGDCYMNAHHTDRAADNVVDEDDEHLGDEDFDDYSVGYSDEDSDYVHTKASDHVANHVGDTTDEGPGDGEMKYEDPESDVEYSEYGKVEGEDQFDYQHGSDVCQLPRQIGRVLRVHANWVDTMVVGQRFDNKDKLLGEVRTIAMKQKFSFAVGRSSRTRFLATCVVKGCRWRVSAAVKDEPTAFWVVKYVKTHTCSVSDRAVHRRRCTPKYIGQIFVEQVGIIDGIAPHHVRDSMRTMFHLRMDYTTAYRSLICAQELVRGTAEDGYSRLPSYLDQLKAANPGTITDFVCEDDKEVKNRFKYLFLSHAASIAGFRYLRRIIVVDGTHLSGKYEGVMLVAAGQDANFQVFPLAFGIVDAECDASWEWFFVNLAKCFSDEWPMVIVSDRHSSIAKACETVMPWATRGICYYHLQQNIVKKFHGKEHMYLVKGAAYAYTVEDYERYMGTLREVNPALAVYLEKADPALWSRVHFPGDRFNIKTSNIAECINSVLKHARAFPVSFLLEFITERLMRWFHKRREDALGLNTLYSRGVETLLAIRDDYADRMTVDCIGGWRFYVRGGSRDCIVDLEMRSCSCKLWDVEKIPCSHAIAAAKSVNIDYATLVSSSYATLRRSTDSALSSLDVSNRIELLDG